MLILCAIIGVPLCLIFLFFLVVHPLICIVECLTSSNLSSGKKALWILLSFFMGIIGSLPYALFASGSTRIRSLTLNGMKFGVLNLLLAIGVFVAFPEIRGTLGVFKGEASAQSVDSESKDSESVDSESKEMKDSLAETSATLGEQEDASAHAEQPRFVNTIDSTPTVKKEIVASIFLEMARKLQNNLKNTSQLKDLIVDAAIAGGVPDGTWTSHDNAESRVGQESIKSKNTTPNKSLESETTTDNSIASELLGKPLPIHDSNDTKTIVAVPAPQSERRDTQITVMTKPERPSKKQPINRYPTKDYDAGKITLPVNTMPQPLTVRNRYKNP
jgi:hypothetical protein